MQLYVLEAGFLGWEVVHVLKQAASENCVHFLLSLWIVIKKKNHNNGKGKLCQLADSAILIGVVDPDPLSTIEAPGVLYERPHIYRYVGICAFHAN